MPTRILDLYCLTIFTILLAIGLTIWLSQFVSGVLHKKHKLTNNGSPPQEVIHDVPCPSLSRPVLSYTPPIRQVRLKNINLRMMLKKVEGNLRAKEQLAEG